MKHNQRRKTYEAAPKEWSGGVDWFRFQTDPFRDTRPLLLAIDAFQRRDVDNASALRPWRFQGYKGWQTASLRWGQREGRVIWESSGERALCMSALTELCTGSCLRIDLQTTLSLSTPQRTFGNSLLRSITRRSSTRRRTPTRLSRLTATSGLWLGTVGTRTSPSYIRIYDKGVESNTAPPGVVWRVEVEAKKSHARELWKTQSPRLTEPAWCAQYCLSSLKSQGCSWPFAPFTTENVVPLLGSASQTTAQSLALWISRSVRPTIPRLLTVFTVAELLMMLGLSDVAGPTGNDNAQR